MQHSDQPYIELRRAREAIEAMRAAQSLDAFEMAWKEYLRYLDRVWNKLEAHFGRSGKWGGWQQRFGRPQKEDPLLRYLRQARNVEEHSIEPIAGRDPGGISINPAEGKALHLKNLVINQGKISFQADRPVVVEFKSGRMKLLAVTNRGVTYNVPTAHLGKGIDPTNVIGIAELAVTFYANALDDAEAFFVT